MSVLPNEGNLQPGAGGAGANPTSFPDGQPLQETLAKVTNDLQRALQRIDSQEGMIKALQSGKDRAVERVVTSNMQMIETLAKYLNKTPEEVQAAQRQAVLDEMVEAKLSGSQSTVTAPANVQSQGATESTTDVVNKSLGLPSNDPRVTDLVMKYGSDTNEYIKQAAALKESLPQPTSPTPAEMPLPGGGSGGSPSTDTNALQAAYERDRQKIFETHRPGSDGAIRALSELQDQYAAKGLNQ